ncbi:MAG TPA: ABC transporter substrate-binding protein [Paludibacter sp.]
MKNLFFRIIFTALSGIFLVACSGKSPETIRIGILDGPSAVSFIKLIDQPPVIEGKKVEIIIKSEPQQIQALMMQDKLDFAILPTIMAANLYNKGVRYRMVACPVWGTLYVLTNTSATGITDLKNQTLSLFGQGSTADVLLQRLIQKNRIENVHIDYTLSNNSDIARALKLRKIKFAVVSEPMVSKLLAQDSTMHILTKLTCEEFLLNSYKNVFVQTSFLVNGRLSMNNRDIVTQICNAYSESCNFLNEQPENAAKLLVKNNILPDSAVARHSIPLCNINYISSFAIAQELESYLRIFYTFDPKSLGGKMPDKDFIYQVY